MFVGIDWASRAHELCVVDELPKTATGKVQKAKLRAAYARFFQSDGAR